jgi:hypothetical protein
MVVMMGSSSRRYAFSARSRGIFPLGVLMIN